MSGFKQVFVTISEAEYRRLHAQDMKDRFTNLPAHQHVIEPARLDLIERMLSTFAERQQTFQEYIDRIGGEIGSVENDSVQALIENTESIMHQFMNSTNFSMQQMDEEKEELTRQVFEREESIQQQIDYGLESVNIQANTMIQDYAERLNAQIEDIRQQQAGQLADIQKRFMLFSDGENQKEMIAHTWLSSAKMLREFIEVEYDHHRFLPGAFDALDNQLQQADENLENRMPEATLAIAQQAYTQLSLKRLELEKISTHWQATYIGTLQRLDELFMDVIACRSIPAIDTSGQELDVQIDLNSWTDENYRALIKEVRDIRTRMQSNAGNIELDELNTILSVRIPKIHQTLSNLVFQARWEVVNSQIRTNIADIAIQALESQGFQVNEHGFKGNNMKNAYRLSLSSVDGSQVIIQVKPLPNIQTGSDLSIESKDVENHTESELRSRSLEITRSLARYGLRVGPISMVEEVQMDKMDALQTATKEPGRQQRLSLIDHD